MKKLVLNLDELAVETFVADGGSGERGTVQGASLPTIPLCTRSGCQTGNCNTATCTVDVCC
jgi:hypothetical protein